MIPSTHTDPKKILLVFLGLCGFCIFASINAPFGHSASLKRDCPKVFRVHEDDVAPCNWCTQIYFSPTEEILVSSKNNTILYRSKTESKFKAAPFTLQSPHSILFDPKAALYYLNDTENNRILAIPSLSINIITEEITAIARIDLNRPHDIINDPFTGWIYTINPLEPVVLRFHPLLQKQGSLNLSKVLGYSRALSLINGRVYVAGSSHGRIVEILDFDKGSYKVYQSASKKRNSSSGNWQQNGLVINDIEYFQNHWYVSSYFTPSSSQKGLDHNKNKLIRFEKWKDFESGNWEDLSSLLPDRLVPYYLTPAEQGLNIALFNHESPGLGDAIYRLVTRCP